MAYNRAYNPDALPAHAEPEQAAQMMGPNGAQRRDHSGSNASYGKPMPPPPSNVPRPDDRYGRPSGGGGYRSPTYGSGPGAGPPPPTNYSPNPDYGRTNSSPRYNQPPPQANYGNYQPRPNSPDYGRNNASSPRYNQPPPQDNYGNLPPRTSSANYGMTSPPPQTNYNQGPRPSGGHHNRPSDSHDDSDPDRLHHLFRQVDVDGSGRLSEAELQRALVNGDFTAFDPHTVKMMIRMFDTDRTGDINFEEFCGLWAFLAEWRKLFNQFDVDRSGSISLEEFRGALRDFGYTLSPEFVEMLFSTFARSRGYSRRGGQVEKVLSFDLFMQACISLKRMTDVFKKYDRKRVGVITLTFEQFLEGAHSLFLFNSISSQTDTGLY